MAEFEHQTSHKAFDPCLQFLLTIKQNGVIMVKNNNAPINPQYIYTVRDWQRGKKHYSFEYMNILSEGVIFVI